MSTEAVTDVHAAMRAWARHSYDLEAGVELAIRTGIADRGEFRACWHPSYTGLALDEDDLLHLARSGASWSGGERRLFAIVASLLHGSCEVNLGDALSNLGRAHVDLVLAAMSHAAGTHEHYNLPHFIGQIEGIPPEPTVDEAGHLAPLHPWPTS